MEQKAGRFLGALSGRTNHELFALLEEDSLLVKFLAVFVVFSLFFPDNTLRTRFLFLLILAMTSLFSFSIVAPTLLPLELFAFLNPEKRMRLPFEARLGTVVRLSCKLCLRSMHFFGSRPRSFAGMELGLMM